MLIHIKSGIVLPVQCVIPNLDSSVRPASSGSPLAQTHGKAGPPLACSSSLGMNWLYDQHGGYVLAT